MNSTGIRRYFGDKAFYRSLLALALPVMLQSALTNLVSFLDNMMVGAVGTDQMSGVSIANTLLFVFNLCIFGGFGGVGIFTAQFFGKRDREGVRDTFRFKIILAFILCTAAMIILLLGHDRLIGLYLHEGSQSGSIAETARWGREYLLIMLWGIVPFAIQQAYASTLRECGETFMPMLASLIAIFLNLILNWVLIFGHFGMPAFGAPGAAIATVIARWTECIIIVVWSHKHPSKAVFTPDAYRSLRVPKTLTVRIIRKGMPLLLNELLWSSGMATLTQCYSMRGLAVVAATNISSVAFNLFNVVWMAMGTAVSIMVGQQLGAGDFEKAKEDVRRIAVFSLISAVASAALLFLVSSIFPRLYNTTDEVRGMASQLLRISACASPLYAFTHVAYFTLRSGGRTWITFMFDSVYVWVIKIVVVWLFITYTDFSAPLVNAISEGTDIIKCIMGYILIKKGLWANNIVDTQA